MQGKAMNTPATVIRDLTTASAATILFLAAPAHAQEASRVSTADSAELIPRGAELFSRFCQRCHNPRSAGERTDREWVIIMQHMETRANLTRSRADLIRRFLMASNAAARMPGTQRESLAAAPRPEDVTDAMIESGRTVFRGEGGCASCHGRDAAGGPIAPSLRDQNWQNGDGSLAAILRVIRNGVSGTAMTAYPAGISDEKARDVAAYVWVISQGKIEP